MSFAFFKDHATNADAVRRQNFLARMERKLEFKASLQDLDTPFVR
ncbi:MAG TPA: hypothetical protein VK983_01530 [Candidatus Limnocylindrales bacterium]|nr:hypothetical protein [Candidatus Limnocylindrales bacterium]